MKKEGFNMEQIQATLKNIEKKLKQNDRLRKLEKQTGVPILYLIGGILVLVVLIVYMVSGLRAITNLVAFVYPAYMTVKAIKSDNKDDDTLWLAYWLWYGLFALIESITNILFFWIPMYELLKMGFYVFLYAPNVQGALILYEKVIQPWLPYLESFEQKVKLIKTSSKKNINETPNGQTKSGNINNNEPKKE